MVPWMGLGESRKVAASSLGGAYRFAEVLQYNSRVGAQQEVQHQEHSSTGSFRAP